MKIRILAFGIAKDILGRQSLEFSIQNGASLADLKASLEKTHPDFSKLTSLRFAVGEEYQSDDFVLSKNEEVVIIPPVAGG